MNKKRMNAMLGSLTALCMTCTTMSNAIVFAQDNTFEVVNENAKETSKPDWNSEASKEKTVFYNGQYFPLLTEALTAAYKDTSTTGTKEIYCKENANVGAMTHGHVADDLIIHGNGAYVSSGERDLEIDTFKYDEKGNQSKGSDLKGDITVTVNELNGIAAWGENVSSGERDLEIDTFKYDEKGNQSKGSDLKGDITVTVNELNGIAAWGERNSNYKVTLNFNNCENMQRIMFRGADATKGTIDINVTNCSFVGNEKDSGGGAYPNASKDTSVHSLYKGTINIVDTKFNNIDVAVNLNNKSDGEQIINITNSTFTNCAQGTESNKTYAAPIRVVAKESGSTSNIKVENCEFFYDEGVVNRGNGDILIGDGRSGETSNGTVNLSMSKTQANVMAQKPGYYGKGGVVENKGNATTTTVQENEVVEKQEVTADKEVVTKPAPTSGSGGGATVKLNPVYRAYNPNNGEHLYTVDEKEYKHVASVGWDAEGVVDEKEYKHVASVGWDAEGVAFMAEEEQNGQALYRVYNPNSGLHHYTLDEKEKNTLVSFGWHDEKVAWYTSKKPQSAPVFRVYNPNDGNHHYTMNKQEKDVLVSYGWQDEGLAFRTAPIEK